MTHSTNTNSQICFTKKNLRLSFSGIPNTSTTSGTSTSSNTQISASALDSRIQRAIKQEKLLQLKKGLYMTGTCYIHEPDKENLSEYLASQIYQPSYISLEYVLGKHNLLSRTTAFPSASEPVTLITKKPTRIFNNFSGYSYSNIKQSLYLGFKKHIFHGNTYHMATKAKAMFDYLYLKSDLNRRNTTHLRRQLFVESSLESNIRWSNFSEENYKKSNKNLNSR